MHNNIMAAGSKDRPPMLGPGRYSQWRSRFLRYIDTKANGEYLRKCIFDGRTSNKGRHSMRMLVKDTRSQDGINDKDNDKGSKSRSQSMKEQAYNKEQRERPRPHELNDKSNLIDLMKECHQ
ncbi:hypothetical protein Tco_0678107 [Tanacetum coccineum]|uniref:Uncharacterized protein n=1 Tax=Tanacetum coccineum TaxID=301880 RepID=A0ABQ4XF08_9ASTR